MVTAVQLKNDPFGIGSRSCRCFEMLICEKKTSEGILAFPSQLYSCPMMISLPHGIDTR